jgi:N-hydroxyarylamine O-acetyltransferase
MLQRTTRDAVMRRLNLAAGVSPNAQGLAATYAAWCERVPFDNLRKLIALRQGPANSLPGMAAEEFFEAWLREGCGATCWPSANALCELLQSLGFHVSRRIGSMRDTGRLSHGSVCVRLDGADWLVDSSMLTRDPLPLDVSPFIARDAVFNCEVEADGEERIVWNDFAPGGMMPCRILARTSDAEEFAARYEASREMSPFNRRLYARKAETARVCVLTGTTWCEKTAHGARVEEVDGPRVLALLRDEFGYGQALLERFVDCGAHAQSLEPPPADAPAPPPIHGLPPSRR